MTSGTLSDPISINRTFYRFHSSFDPAAEKTCEDLLNLALQVDPGNSEAYQSLASVRLSQQRPDDAKQCLEQAWTSWKDLEAGTSANYLSQKPHN